MTSIQIDLKDGLSSSVAIKGPCIVATTANITLSGEQTIDGVAVVTDDRVLVKDQTTGSENGIWICDTGAWRRSKDFNKTKDIKTGTMVNVVGGTIGVGWWQVATAGDITVGTTSIAFTRSIEVAAGLPFPPVANTFLQRNAGNTAYDAKTPTQALAAMGGLAAAQNLADVADEVSAQNNLNYQRTPGSATFAIISSMTKMSQRADLRDWNGLDLTGVNDNATLVRAAVNAMAAAGVRLDVPAGKITLGSTITVPVGANIQGVGLPADRNGALSAYNTYFHLAHLGAGFSLSGGLGNRRVAGFGTYRDNPSAAPGWVPADADYDIKVSGVYDFIVEDIFIYNGKRGIGVGGDLTGAGSGCGRGTIQRIRGQPMFIGLSMTHCYDVMWVDNIHWWPYASFDANITSYMAANANAFLVGRVDNAKVGRLFSYGMRNGLVLQNQASVGLDGSLPPGPPSLFKADAVGIDACTTALFVSTNATYDIDMLYGAGVVGAGGDLVDINGSNSVGAISRLYGQTTNASLVNIRAGTGNDLKVGSSHSLSIDADSSGDAEFKVSSGNTLTLMAAPIVSATNSYSGAGTINRYQVGNWTPTLTFGGASTGLTYGTVVGKYVRNGQLITAQFDMALTAKGSSTGTAVISGLPFTSQNDGQIGSVQINFSANMTGLTGVLSGYTALNSTTISLQQSSATGTANLTDAVFTNTSRIVGTVTYRAI